MIYLIKILDILGISHLSYELINSDIIVNVYKFLEVKENTLLNYIDETNGIEIKFGIIKMSDEDKRKDPVEKAKLINASDYTFLCLPDAAAIESAALCTNPNTKIIDASTAHRTNPEWAYGFPELDKSFREKIVTSNRVAVPGCYASGSIAILYPLVKNGIMPKDYPVVIHAVSGYSGQCPRFRKSVCIRYDTQRRARG